MDNYSNNNNYNSENGNLNDMMMQEFANMIGDIEVSEIDNYEKCEFIYKEFYRKYNTLIPLIEFFEDNLPMQEYIRSLGSKFHIEDNEAEKNIERLEDNQKSGFNTKNTFNNTIKKRDDLKNKNTIEFEQRFREKKLDLSVKRSCLDFDDLIEQDYPTEYIAGHHDEDIKNIFLSAEEKPEYFRKYSEDAPKNNIGYDNFKLLLVLMKNKKSALYEKNIYNNEYSTEYDLITKDHIDKSLSNKNSENYSEDYLEKFKSLFEN